MSSRFVAARPPSKQLFPMAHRRMCCQAVVRSPSSAAGGAREVSADTRPREDRWRFPELTSEGDKAVAGRTSLHCAQPEIFSRSLKRICCGSHEFPPATGLRNPGLRVRGGPRPVRQNAGANRSRPMLSAAVDFELPFELFLFSRRVLRRQVLTPASAFPAGFSTCVSSRH